MNPGTLLIRADASVAMGMGHIMRCLALAQAWQDNGGRITFAVAENPPGVAERLHAEGVDVVPLDVQVGSSGDAIAVVQLAGEHGARWVVLDGRQFGQDYESALKSARLKLMVIDDGGLDRPCPADFILNQNFGAAESMYAKCDVGTILLLGTKYTLLRKEFLVDHERKPEIERRAEKLLVTMGGSDPDNLTNLVIQAFRFTKTAQLRATVIVGGSNPHFQHLQSEVAELDADVQLETNVSDMSARMAQADLVIIAAGGTLWESLFMARPTLSFGRDHVQRRILELLHKEGAVYNLADPRQMSASDLAATVDELAGSYERRVKMAAAGRELVDGNGGRRVCKMLLSSN